jgi:hypothetical protein
MNVQCFVVSLRLQRKSALEIAEVITGKIAA